VSNEYVEAVDHQIVDRQLDGVGAIAERRLDQEAISVAEGAAAKGRRVQLVKVVNRNLCSNKHV